MRFTIGCTLVALATVAHAESRTDADVHARRGVALYNLGKYQEAIDEFEDAYKDFQSDALLFNLAQAHRKLEHCDRALTYYHQFLAGTPAPALAEQVVKLLPELEAACRTRDARPDGPVTPAALETRPVTAAAEPEPEAEAEAAPVEASPATLHFGAAGTFGEVISGGNAPVTGVRLTATMLPSWWSHTELGVAVGVAQLWRYASANDATIGQLAAMIEHRSAFEWGRWTAGAELGVEYISMLGVSRDVVPGVSPAGQWAPLGRGELGIEHDISPLFALRVAVALAGCPPVGGLEAAIGELDLVVGLVYAR